MHQDRINFDLGSVVLERLKLISLFQQTFRTEIEPDLKRWSRRGLIQGRIFKLLNLPRTGLHMKLCNEAIEKLGYKQIMLNGWRCFRKI